MKNARRNRYTVGTVTLGVAAVLFTGCAKVPQAEIDAAQGAISQVKAEGATLYASETFIALEDSMNATMEMISAQDAKLFKNFDAPKEGLKSILLMAEQVKAETQTRKDEMK